MKINLTKKIAYVTGGTKGIGKAIALALASSGAEVVVCGRGKEQLDATIAEIQKLGAKAHGQCIDATRPDEVKKIFSDIILKIGRLDILVNNIGSIERFGGFLELSDEDWKRCYDINFMSMVYNTRESIPLLKQSSGARIINICSIAAKQPGFYNPHYTAAKAAMLNLSKHLANVLAKDKILVNTICLGTVKTEIWPKSVENKQKQLGISFEEAEKIFENEEKEKNPLHQIGMPEDIANVVLFLASDKAQWITGSCFTVDGGTTRALF